MTQVTTWLPAGLLAGLLATVILTPSVRAAGEIGFPEDFALARDRSIPLKQLIPGTEDFYYYHALQLLNTEQYEKVEDLTRPWHERHGQTSRLTEIQTRHALLTYDKNPKRSLDYLRGRLGLSFNHEREILGAAPNLPIALDPKLISRTTLRANTFSRWSNLDNFEDTALDWLAGEELTWERRRNLLQRLQRPDVPNLPKLVFDDLQSPHAQPFGSYTVHGLMTIPQLDDLLKLQPDLLNHMAFVRSWVSKLQPSADSDWRRNRAEAKAYLDRLQAFAVRLAPVHNAFKAHVLYHRLALDRAEGTYDKDRFLTYLRLPRQQGYMAKALLESEEARRYPADIGANFAGVTLLPPIGTDEELVRA